MSEINWALWLVSGAGGILVGCIVLVIGMWMDKIREEREAEDPISPENAPVYLDYPPQFFPGADKKDNDNA